MLGRRADAVAVGLVAGSALLGLALWPALPAEMAVHWSGGVPDRTLARPLAVLGLPALGVALVALVRLAPEAWTTTPGGETLGVLFLGATVAYVQGVVLVWNLGVRFDIGLAVLPVLAGGAALVWLSLR